MPEKKFTTQGMAKANLGMAQWGSGKNLREFLTDINEYTSEKSGLESDYGMAGHIFGGFLDYFVAPAIGLPPGTFTLLGGWGGREYGERKAGDAPTREDYDIMFGEGTLQDIESQFAIDEEQYSDMNQFLESLGVTTNVLTAIYGPGAIGEMLAGGGAGAGAGTTDFGTYGRSFSLTGSS